MELATYLQKFKTSKKNLGPEQILADEIWRYFGKKLSFPRVFVLIKNCGAVFVREVFEEIRKGDPRDRLALFVYRCKNCHIRWES